MRHYGVTLAPGQPLRVIHDIRDCAIDFADVVKERDPLHAVLFSLVEIGSTRERECIVGDTPDMGAGFGVVRIDCVEEALESSCSETLESEPFPPLAIKEGGCSRTHEKRGKSQEIVGKIDGA